MTERSKSPQRCQPRSGFSLLEMIIATEILAASTILLLGLFSTGERHANRAETLVMAQMLCQSTLDELLADPSQLRPVDDEPIEGYEDWTFSVDWKPTEITGLVAIRVSVKRQTEIDSDVGASRLVNQAGATRGTFELLRWARIPSESGAVLALDTQTSAATEGGRTETSLLPTVQ